MRGVRGSVKYEHGTENCYINNDCRRPECRAAATRARKIRRYKTKDQAIPLRVNAVGSVRRLQALMAMGWSLPRLEEAAGVRPWYYRQIMFAGPAVLDRSRARQISRLYDELWDQEPPQTNRAERFSVSRTKTIARDNGYAPPMAWAGIDMDDPEARPAVDAVLDPDEMFDWVKVERVVAGRADSRELNSAEKLAAAKRLMQLGLGVTTAAGRVHMAAPTLRQRLAEERELVAA